MMFWSKVEKSMHIKIIWLNKTKQKCIDHLIKCNIDWFLNKRELDACGSKLNGDEIDVNGEQARSDSTCTVLWAPHHPRKPSPWRQNPS